LPRDPWDASYVSVQMLSTVVQTRCCPNGTKLYWPAVECYHGAIIRLEAAWCHRLAYVGDSASSLIIAPWSVTDDDDRRQRAKQYCTPTLCVDRDNNDANRSHISLSSVRNRDFLFDYLNTCVHASLRDALCHILVTWRNCYKQSSTRTNIVDNTAFSSASTLLRMRTTVTDGHNFLMVRCLSRDFLTSQKTQFLPTAPAFVGGDPIGISSKSFVP